MEELGFDIGGILSEEEANKLFEEQTPDEKEQETEVTENDSAEKEGEDQPSGKVGEEEDIEKVEDSVGQTDGGSSPNIFSSIASALKKDGIFPDFEDSYIESIKTPEDFAEMFKKAIRENVDERTNRVNELLDSGVAPDKIKMYEQTIEYLGSITDEALSAEGEDGENIRKQLIYNDLINRGYTQEKANKEIEKSFATGNDVDDAKDALEALKNHYNKEYESIRKEAKKRNDDAVAAQKKQADDFKKMVLDDDLKLGETVLDKTTCKKIYEAVSNPVYKDPDTGRLLTAVQKFQKEQPLEFLKQLGMWYVLTDGGKSLEGLTKEQLRSEKNKNIKELAHKINSTSLNSDGSLRYASGGTENSDPLLSDGWKVGW